MVEKQSDGALVTWVAVVSPLSPVFWKDYETQLASLCVFWIDSDRRRGAFVSKCTVKTVRMSPDDGVLWSA